MTVGAHYRRGAAAVVVVVIVAAGSVNPLARLPELTRSETLRPSRNEARLIAQSGEHAECGLDGRLFQNGLASQFNTTHGRKRRVNPQCNCATRPSISKPTCKSKKKTTGNRQRRKTTCSLALIHY